MTMKGQINRSSICWWLFFNKTSNSMPVTFVTLQSGAVLHSTAAWHGISDSVDRMISNLLWPKSTISPTFNISPLRLIFLCYDWHFSATIGISLLRLAFLCYDLVFLCYD